MKKITIALLMSVLMVLAVPATAVAAPAPPAVHTLEAEMDIMAVARFLNYQPTPQGIVVTGSVYYMGTVVDASRKYKDWEKLVGAEVLAQEDVNYLIMPNGDVIIGKVEGTLKIIGSGPASAIVNYKADVWGNVIFGPAGDNGTWEVAEAYGPFNILKDAKGIWTAYVEMVPTGYPPPNDYTFAGKAYVTGTYK